jgi:ATP-dependent DNA helicase RecG
MNKKELIKKLEDIEWEEFEVKEAKLGVPKSTWETISAFSNTAGGWLIFGVKKSNNSFSIVGVENPEKIEQTILSTLRSENKFNKIIETKNKKYDVGGKIILAFYIPQKSPRDKPIYFNSQKNTFIRTGSGDQRATQEEIDNFLRCASFEEKDKELTNCTIKDLDNSTITQYRRFFIQNNPAHHYNGLDDIEFLSKLNVIKNSKITFGGLLVFGTDDALSNELINYRTEYLEIPGKSYVDSKTRYNFRISSEQNLFQTFFQIYERLTSKVDVPFKIHQGFRNDDPTHIQALREALVNLIMHTDYFSKSNPRIRFFDNRIEFFNPGALPKKLELIIKEDFSLPRNPIIAKIFRYINLSENIGSGFHKMLYGWEKNYYQKPIITGDFDYYTITFPLTTSKTTIKTTTKTNINKEHEIMEILNNNPHLNAKDIAKAVDLTVDGVRYHINNLTKKGIIKRMGSSKKGKWEMIK